MRRHLHIWMVDCILCRRIRGSLLIPRANHLRVDTRSYALAPLSRLESHPAIFAIAARIASCHLRYRGSNRILPSSLSRLESHLAISAIAARIATCHLRHRGSNRILPSSLL